MGIYDLPKVFVVILAVVLGSLFITCHGPYHGIHTDTNAGERKECRPKGRFRLARFVYAIPDISEYANDGEHLEAHPTEICVFAQCVSR